MRERESKREQSTTRKKIGQQALITLSFSLSLFFYFLLCLMTAALLSSFTPPPSFSSVATMSNDDTSPNTTTTTTSPLSSRATKHQSLPSSSKNYSVSSPESSFYIQSLNHHDKVKKRTCVDKSKEHVGNPSFYFHHPPFL